MRVGILSLRRLLILVVIAVLTMLLAMGKEELQLQLSKFWLPTQRSPYPI